jgi:hypothetical protein
MNDKPDAPEPPAPMTEFERSALILLKSIDQRLKSIDEAAGYFHRQAKVTRESMLAMSRNFPRV